MLISLWGFMGAGKSTIGRRVADQVGWKCVDTDSKIESEQGKTIPEIFEQSGEGAFRRLESALLQQLYTSQSYDTENIILITGGGMPIPQENRVILGQLGLSVFIDVPFTTIVKRLQDDQHRPLWNPAALEQMKVKYEERMPVYRTADLVINGEDGADQIIEQIVRVLHNKL